MNERPRLSDAPETEQASQLLSSGVEGLDRPWSATAQAEVGLELEARLTEHTEKRVFAFVLASVVALITGGLVFLWNLQREESHRVIVLGDEATLKVTEEGEIELPASLNERRVVLKAGEVCVQVAHRDVPRQGPLVVDAPRMKVVVVGTQFCVATANGVSTVSVSQGRIRAESPTGSSVFVDAGQVLRSDDPRLAAIVPKAEIPELVPSGVRPRSPPVTSRCAGVRTLQARRNCLAEVAQGTGIAAQNALYGLGLLELDEARDGSAAVKAWQTYLARFPKGIFAPEAALASLSELLHEKRYSEALRETDQYLATGDESAVVRVALIRAQLLVGPLSQPAQALDSLRQLAATADASLREEILYTLGRCQLALWRYQEAQETFRRLMAEYPGSIHAMEIRSWVQ